MKTHNYFIAALIVMVTAIAIAFAGCNEDENNPVSVSQNNYPIENVDEIDPTDVLLFTNNKPEYKNSKAPIKLIQIDLWRRHHDCERLGICEIMILGDTIYQSKYFDNPLRQIVMAIDGQNQETSSILNLLLAEPIPEGITSDELRFYVDEDIYGYEENSDDYVVFPQGIYDFNPNLGEYGGYSVFYSTGKIIH